jgi:precorrin-6A synthase
VTRAVLVIGIGAGDPEHLTLQAVAAMNRVDVFFTIDKGEATGDLAALRAELLARHVTRPHRIVTAPEVPRDRDPAAYVATATRWQARREALYEEMITTELADGRTGGFLVWGDPSLYDGTLNLLRSIAARTPLEIVAIPGISSVAALAAAHRLILNRVGTPILITTGRRLAEQGMPVDVDDVVVMLDGRTAFTALADTDLDIYWGAYLGTKDEILVSGALPAVRDEIVRRRAEARAGKGWIMDTYLLRRRGSATDQEPWKASAGSDEGELPPAPTW